VSAHAERTRQWVHVGSGAFALLLRYLTWWQAIALAAFAVVFNVLILPRIGGRRLYRPIDEARGFPLGILLYPLAVLGLILAFSKRLDLAASAWAILALGDGTATLVGRGIASPTLPWNREKTVSGTLAFIIFGALGGVALMWWMRSTIEPPPSLTFVLVAPVVGAITAAFVETIPIRLDDNISVPVTAGVVLAFASMCSWDAFHASHDRVAGAVPWALAVNGVASYAGYRAGTVNRAGLVGGAIVGVIVYAGAGGAAWLLLFATFLFASVTSRLGLKRKMLLGIAEERGGRRGAGNAIANCGVAVVAAIVAICSPHLSQALLALVAALAAGGSDTVASEIGKAWGRATFLVTTLRPAKPGTPGAMSLEGTAAGVVAALGLGAIGAALDLVPATAIPLIVVAATAGALVESALAATLEGPGILNNDMLNFLNTAVAAAVVLALA
jgi:uncharacterized protein (TIGR00297 family)